MNVQMNMNHYVLVKLTDHGINILVEQHRELYDSLIERNNYTTIRTPEEFKENLIASIEKNKGYYRTQLWSLMEKFGGYLFNGCDLPFQVNIILEHAEDIKS